MPYTNPFQVGGIVPPEKFINHQSEIRRCVSNILTGQSSALTSEPGYNKTSLLYSVDENFGCQDP